MTSTGEGGTEQLSGKVKKKSGLSPGLSNCSPRTDSLEAVS